MVIIRLARGGTKKRPFFYVVVTNSRSSRDGRFIERLGFYNPIAVGGEIKLQVNKERVDYWLANGAKVSDKVAYLIDNFAKIVAFGVENTKEVTEKKSNLKSVVEDSNKENEAAKIVE